MKKSTSIRMRILRLSLISVAVVIIVLSSLLVLQLNYISTRAYSDELQSLATTYANVTQITDDYSKLNLSTEHLGANALINIVNTDGVIVASSDAESVGTSLTMKVSYGIHELGNNLIACCTQAEGTGIDVVIVGNISETRKLVLICLVISLTIGAILAIAAVIVSFKISKQIVTPIIVTTSRLVSLSQGDIQSEVQVFNRRDETEKLSKSLQLVCSELGKYVSNIVNTTNEMANGDFSYTQRMEYLGDFEGIPAAFSQIHDMLQETIQNLSESSISVRSGSDQISSGAQTLAEGTTKQAAAADELSATITDISRGVELTATGANEASNISSNCAIKMHEQDIAMTKMLDAMKTIEQKSEAISNVIKTIEDIAFQTNILSLNASIEAARAGEAGKGFAVVASEVGNLAQKSAQSANSTRELITSSLDAVSVGAQIANEAADALKEAIQLSETSASLVRNIAEDANKQADALAQATKGVEEISQVIQMNSATAEESAASCEELSAQAKLLNEQISKLKA